MVFRLRLHWNQSGLAGLTKANLRTCLRVASCNQQQQIIIVWDLYYKLLTTILNLYSDLDSSNSGSNLVSYFAEPIEK